MVDSLSLISGGLCSCLLITIWSSRKAGFISWGPSPLYQFCVSARNLEYQLPTAPFCVGRKKAVDLEIYNKLLVIESCADSTERVVAILNRLKPPFSEGEEVKYCAEVMPVEMFPISEGRCLCSLILQKGRGNAIPHGRWRWWYGWWRCTDQSALWNLGTTV